MAVQGKQIKAPDGTVLTPKTSTISQQKVITAVVLALIILLGAFLRLYQLGAYNIGNTYYAATVKSMLTSWSNFFFGAYEPGGSVTVDKPPLGFWVQAISAYFLGVNGFALALPNALAGLLSIPLLFSMVKRQFGVWAGLLASLALAVIPITVATERNNTIDGLLVFVLLLAAWAVLKAVSSKKARYLMLSALLVGLGFNIKMLQAYMVLPALFAVYFFGARQPWWKRLGHLALASILLLIISLSWAVAVDLVPASQRPFIGSSTDNTVMELIIGHNGLKRLGLSSLLDGGSDGRPSTPDGLPAPYLTGDGNRLPAQDGPLGGRANGGTSRQPFSHEVGAAGFTRLFSEPLSEQASWLLPLVLLGIPLITLQLGWRWPLREKHLGLLLWAGWLLPVMTYFSFTTGLFHAYYLIMLGPPLAALFGLSIWAFWRAIRRWPWFGWALLVLVSSLTLAFQIYIMFDYPQYNWVMIAAALVWLAGAGLLLTRNQPWMGKLALALVCISLVVAPLTWSTLTALESSPKSSLPNAGTGDSNRRGGVNDGYSLKAQEQALLNYLLINTEPGSYLLATLSAHQASGFILASDRPVLTFGGFSGGDDVIGVDELAEMVASGQLRFVLGSELSKRKPEINRWVQANCRTVNIPGLGAQGGSSTSRNSNPNQQNQAEMLYDCSPNKANTTISNRQ